MLSASDAVLLLAAAIVVVPSFKIFVLGPDKDPKSIPPGPTRLGKGPFDMPAEPYKRFMELAKEYGAYYDI